MSRLTTADVESFCTEPNHVYPIMFTCRPKVIHIQIYTEYVLAMG